MGYIYKLKIIYFVCLFCIAFSSLTFCLSYLFFPLRAHSFSWLFLSTLCWWSEISYVFLWQNFQSIWGKAEIFSSSLFWEGMRNTISHLSQYILLKISTQIATLSSLKSCLNISTGSRSWSHLSFFIDEG